MELLLILAACFVLLFIVEVFLGGAPPVPESGSGQNCGRPRGRLRMGEFFGYALPLAATAIGVPMSVQPPWALALVAGAALMYMFVCRVLRAC